MHSLFEKVVKKSSQEHETHLSARHYAVRKFKDYCLRYTGVADTPCRGSGTLLCAHCLECFLQSEARSWAEKRINCTEGLSFVKQGGIWVFGKIMFPVCVSSSNGMMVW
ncbi:hypothetical protein CEXT_595061 [Caerostris extrusa]|uniref:Uncharacterized protein n=1 Tax=Caerostris extrusa TaxID=172846 RepID=A0AAV4QTW8_CAEEX|nr:hypothetical protein CEXT_595061 [Caerostris extrusa]